jgi:hypothetical protein
VAPADEIIDDVVRAVKGFGQTAKKLAVHVGAGFEEVRADIKRRVKQIEKS